MKFFFLLLEIPLALLSFLFYKIIKFIVGNLYIIYLSLNKKKAFQWRVISSELIESPLSLPVLMTKGPRWNTHAIIGTLGPFTVKNFIELDVTSANKSARSWIAIFYSFPGYQTIDTIESALIKPDIQWQKLSLKSGQYTIALRYYEREESLNFPAIKIDGQDFVTPQSVPNNINDFYLDLSQKTNWFYLSLHYYIFTILKFRKWLPASFVNYEYLPVGATDTNFIYNFLDSKQALKITTQPSILDNYNIHFTSYNRASFPLQSFAIDTEEKTVAASDRQGFYLLRLRPKSGSSESINSRSIDWKISDEDQQCQNLTVTS